MGSRRLIDYVVIPTAIRDDIVSFKVDKTRPWKPHYGLELEIKKDVGEGVYWKLARPPPLFGPSTTANDGRVDNDKPAATANVLHEIVLGLLRPRHRSVPEIGNHDAVL